MQQAVKSESAARLTIGQIVDWLVEDKIAEPQAAEKLKKERRHYRGAMHPLVMVAEQKWRKGTGPGATPLTLEALTEWLAKRAGMEYLHIDPLKIDFAAVTEMMSSAYATRFHILPVAFNAREAVVATAEPAVRDWEPELSRLIKRDIKRVIANPLDIDRYQVEFYNLAKSIKGANKTTAGASGLSNFEQLVELGKTDKPLDANDAHVVRIVDWLWQYAFEQRASDIHIEPRRDQGIVRFRIDGVLHQVYQIPSGVLNAMTSRIKILARMDVVEKRRPQDGRVKTRTAEADIELRISTLPTAFGEKLVMRIFDPEVLVRDFSELGFSEEDHSRWKEMTERPNGIVLVTGPTGSGKTTTLYSTLKSLATPEVNVCTIEDPIEMVEPAFNQMQVQNAIDLGFAEGVRALMRQDPDIIMVGEIRDLETAEMAVQSALTGHLVLSTLHTNDAPSAVARLLELGVAPYLLNATLNGVMAQRLVRTLCKHCKKAVELHRAEDHAAWDALTAPWKSNHPAQVYQAVGCLECRKTGFMGRIGIYETLLYTSELKTMVAKGTDLVALREQAFKEGMKPLRISGAMKVGSGLTTMDEVLKVAPPVRDPAARWGVLDVLLLVAVAVGAVYLAMHFLSRRRERDLLKAHSEASRFRGLTELSADWFWETDAEHRIVWLSGGAPVATFFGQTPTYGKRLWEIPGVEVESRSLQAHRESLQATQPFFDLEIARSDARGARQVHIVSGQARLDAAGHFLGYRGVGRDITEQRRAERALFHAKERLEVALDGGNLAEFHFDAERGELSAGDGWVRFLGHQTSPSVTLGAELVAMMHPDDRAPYTDALVRALKGEAAAFDTEFRIRTHSGEWKWLHARGRVTEHSEAGRARQISGTVADIDERKRAEAVLAEREQRFRDVVDASGEYVWETDAEWRYTYLSERAEEVLGYPREELLGRRARDFMPLGEPRMVDDWLAVRAVEGEPFRDLLHRMITRSGGVIWQSVSAVPVRDAQGKFAGWRGTGADVTARKHAEARIEHLATRDALTGLPNATLLADRVGQAVLAAARSRSQCALLCIDLDRFKLVNDSLGHRAGDALLRAVAERLGNVLHRDDTLARLGGDDFVLVQSVKPEEDAAAEAAALAQRLLGVLARPFTVEGKQLGVAASIGISIYPDDGRDFVELLKNADAALYHAKESGKGTWRLFAPALNARAAERLRLENELRGALARNELVLHWQPVVQGRDRLVGAEALVRWQHPSRGLLLPEQFVPLAEECGLIRAVDDWVLERALSQAGAWQRRFGRKFWTAVNVSAAGLAQGAQFEKKLRALLAVHSLQGNQIELEVTERTLMLGLTENVATLKAIGELGVRFAIDDFGTGYSSLAYLRQLPIDKLKIDRSFLRSIDSQAADAAIVRAITVLAGILGISVAAEGVETAAQLERLRALGCEEWQGHYFSAPLDAAAFETLISGQGSTAATKSG